MDKIAAFIFFAVVICLCLAVMFSPSICSAEQEVDDETLWHKCSGAPLFAKVNGGRTSGQMWRRKINGKWEYRQDEQTLEEFSRDAW